MARLQTRTTYRKAIFFSLVLAFLQCGLNFINHFKWLRLKFSNYVMLAELSLITELKQSIPNSLFRRPRHIENPMVLCTWLTCTM